MTQSSLESIEISKPLLLLEWWKPVTSYEGYYEVSNTGTVRHVGKSNGLGGCITQKGYKIVVLCKEKYRRTIAVHRIVATHFVGPKPHGMVTNHIDGVKLNNRASNFNYVTCSENTRHAMRLGNFTPYLNLKNYLQAKNQEF